MPNDPTPEEAQEALSYASEMGVDMKELGVELADVPDEVPAEEAAPVEEPVAVEEPALAEEVEEVESKQQANMAYQARIAKREELVRENAQLAAEAAEGRKLKEFFSQVVTEQQKLADPGPPDPKVDGPGYLDYTVKKNLDEAIAPIREAVGSLTAEQKRKAEREQYNEMMAAGGREIEQYQATPQGAGFEDRFNTWANRYASVAIKSGVPEKVANQRAAQQALLWASEARQMDIPPSAWIDLQVQSLSGGAATPAVSSGNGKSANETSNVAHLREVASGASGKISGAAETPSRTIDEPADVLRKGDITPADFAKLASQQSNLDVASNVDAILRQITAAGE